jgi:hypothetical protein
MRKLRCDGPAESKFFTIGQSFGRFSWHGIVTAQVNVTEIGSFRLDLWKGFKSMKCEAF